MPRLILLLLIFAGVAGVGVLYLAPAWREFTSLRQQTENLHTLSGEVDELVGNLNSVGSIITKIKREDLDRIERALPKGPQSAEFLVDLEKMVLTSGLLLRRTDVPTLGSGADDSGERKSGQPRPVAAPSGAPRANGIKEVTVTFTVAGSYDAFKRFLAELERFTRVVTVKELTFVAPSRPGDPIEFTMRSVIYYQ